MSDDNRDVDSAAAGLEWGGGRGHSEAHVRLTHSAYIAFKANSNKHGFIMASRVGVGPAQLRAAPAAGASWAAAAARAHAGPRCAARRLARETTP